MAHFEDEILQLLTVKGFDKAFSELLDNPLLHTQEKVYNHLENICLENFGRRRYSCFDSYRKTRTRRLKKK